MKVDIAKKWVRALRSGKYLQTRGKLEGKRSDGKIGNCCLGVLCRLAIKDGIAIATQQDDEDSVLFNNEHGTLPDEVQTWAGMKNPVGDFGQGENDFLAHRNDHGASFKQIANIIEKHVKDL